MLQSLMHATDFINEIYMTRSVYDYLRSISLSLLTLDMIGMFNCLDKHSFFLSFSLIYMYTLNTITLYWRAIVFYDVY